MIYVASTELSKSVKIPKHEVINVLQKHQVFVEIINDKILIISKSNKEKKNILATTCRKDMAL